MKRRPAFAMLGIMVLIATGSGIHAHLDGAPPGYSGVPGEGSCGDAGCHNIPHASWSGQLSLHIRPGSEGALARFQVSISEDYDRALLHGFQATVTDSLLNIIGEFVLVDTSRTRLITDSQGDTYVSHTTEGTTPSAPYPTIGLWYFEWRRPDDYHGVITVHAAGLLADGDMSEEHDVAVTSILNIYPDCGIEIAGDVNESGRVTSADIIYLGGYIFRGDVAPKPCAANGDVNCDGVVTSADMIYLINYVFKGQSAPCDICSLVWDNVWWCI